MSAPDEVDENEDEILIDGESPVGREWKEQWRAKEKDPSKKRETREDKRAARRQLHKRDRRQAKESLRKYES